MVVTRLIKFFLIFLKCKKYILFIDYFYFEKIYKNHINKIFKMKRFENKYI